jgi:hypothetical protein
MSNATQSEYEIERKLEQYSASRHRKLHKAVTTVRHKVERALSLNSKAEGIEWQVRAFENNTDGFRARARADRRDWLLLWVFWGTILAYIVLEFMTSGDIAEMLACQMAPLFGVDSATGAMPIWLRRGAGAGFVAAMLLVTLLAKLASGYALNALNTARAGLSTGEGGRYFRLICGMWGIYLGKLAYVGAVAALYFWLFGFAQQRAAIMADLAAGQKLDSGWNDLAIKIEGGDIQQDAAASEESQVAPAAETVSRLAGATGVFYSAIIAIHALVLFGIPTNGFSRELELAHFKKGTSDKRVASLRGKEQKTLREIYEHVRIAPQEYRGELVEATEPVHGAINQLYGRRVIGISGIPTNHPGGSPAETSAGFEIPHGPSSAHGPNGTEPVSETEAPAANWDAIFPPRQA